MRGNRVKADKKISTSLALEPKAIEIIDTYRGKKSRSSFINDMILERVDVGT